MSSNAAFNGRHERRKISYFCDKMMMMSIYMGDFGLNAGIEKEKNSIFRERKKLIFRGKVSE